MKVSVFGASGFVGRNMIKALVNENIETVASDIKEDSIEGVHVYPANILEYDQVKKIVHDSDYIIHLAASPLPLSLKNPTDNARINIIGTLNIMDAARECGVKKVIFSSASSIVGDVLRNPVDETHPCTPKTPYGVAKYAIEHYLRVYKEIFGLDYLVFRFFNIYGPWQLPESGALIPMIYNKLKNTGSFDILGDGTQVRDYVYVGDIADFIIKGIKNEQIKNEILNMGTGSGGTIKEVIETAAGILNITPTINYKPPRPGEISNFVADTTKMKQLFGSAPSTDLKKGLSKTYTWLDSYYQK